MLAYFQAQMGGDLMLLTKLILAFAAGMAIWRIGRAPLFVVANRLMALVVVYNLTLATYALAAIYRPGLLN